MGALYSADFIVRDNADWRDAFELRDGASPWDLTGAVLTMTLRKRKSVAPEDTMILTNNDGIVLVDATAGIFEIRVLAEATAELAVGHYDHDLLITQGGYTTSLFSGEVTVEKGVS